MTRQTRYYFEADFGSNNLKDFVQLRDGEPTDKEIHTVFISPEIGTTERILFQILADFFYFGADVFKAWKSVDEMEEKVRKMLGTGKLTMYNNVGEAMKEWQFKGMWPHSVNFGELCYSTDSTVELDVTWRYQEMGSASLVKT